MSFENTNGFVQEQEKDEILEVTIRAPKNKHKKLAPIDSDCDSPREPPKKEKMAKVNKMEKQVDNLESFLMRSCSTSKTRRRSRQLCWPSSSPLTSSSFYVLLVPQWQFHIFGQLRRIISTDFFSPDICVDSTL